MLRSCDVSDSTFIVAFPFAKKTCRRQDAKVAGVGLQARITCVPATGLDSFAMTCLLSIGSGALLGASPQLNCELTYYLSKSEKPAVVFTRKVTFFITGLENRAVLNNNTKTAGKAYFPEKL
jgi:hypothetical protein